MLRRRLADLSFILISLAAGCRVSATIPPPPAPQPDPLPAAPPASVDLRGDFAKIGLAPRAQGGRGTCSVFTTCEAIEFALAKKRGHLERQSVEFLNWAGGQASGAPSDGNFFHNALSGFVKFGICNDTLMPYGDQFHPDSKPPANALAEAAATREESRGAVLVHWIVPWVAAHAGVDDAQFTEIRSVLARGWPVAAGSGHSRLLVGYRDDPAAPGGGIFLTLDSALAAFSEVSYEFVRKDVCDVFWVEARAAKAL